MKAAREAVRRDPALLVEMVDLYQPMGLTDTEWLVIVPERAVDRLELAMVLEARRRRVGESRRVPRRGGGGAAARRGRLSVGAGRGPRPCRRRRRRGHRAARGGRRRRGQPRARAGAGRRAGAPERSRGARPSAAGRHRHRSAGRRRRASTVPRRRQASGRAHRASGARSRSSAALSPRAGGLPHRARIVGPGAAGVADARAGGSAERRGALRTRSGAGRGRRDGRGAGGLSRAPSRWTRMPCATGAVLADRLWQSEQYFQAINEWQTIKSQAPDDLEARLALARALEKVGQPVEAYREYRDVLGSGPRPARSRPRGGAARRPTSLGSPCHNSPQRGRRSMG